MDDLLAAWRRLTLAQRWRFLSSAPEVYAATERLVAHAERPPLDDPEWQAHAAKVLRDAASIAVGGAR